MAFHDGSLTMRTTVIHLVCAVLLMGAAPTTKAGSTTEAMMADTNETVWTNMTTMEMTMSNETSDDDIISTDRATQTVTEETGAGIGSEGTTAPPHMSGTVATDPQAAMGTDSGQTMATDIVPSDATEMATDQATTDPAWNDNSTAGPTVHQTSAVTLPAINCYQCNGTDANCPDSKFDAVAEKTTILCSGHCVKEVTDNTGQRPTSRYCETGTCSVLTGEGGVERYCCKESLCNSAISRHDIPISGLIAVFLTLIVKDTML